MFHMKAASKKSYGILYGEDSEGNSNYGYYCASYDPDFRNVQQDKADAVSYLCYVNELLVKLAVSSTPKFQVYVARNEKVGRPM